MTRQQVYVQIVATKTPHSNDPLLYVHSHFIFSLAVHTNIYINCCIVVVAVVCTVEF